MALDAARAGELPYASLLVDAEGTVVARACNTVRSTGDITNHPELILARHAALTRSAEACRALTLYTSCEPCVMCRNVIARAGIGRVVFALSTEQLHRLQPPGEPRPDAARVEYRGPSMFDRAQTPVRVFYDSV